MVEPPPLGSGRPPHRGHRITYLYTQEPCEYISYLFTVTCTYKVVEAAGVEPASEDPAPSDSTCVSALNILASGVEGRRKPPEDQPRYVLPSRVGAARDGQPAV